MTPSLNVLQMCENEFSCSFESIYFFRRSGSLTVFGNMKRARLLIVSYSAAFYSIHLDTLCVDMRNHRVLV